MGVAPGSLLGQSCQQVNGVARNDDVQYLLNCFYPPSESLEGKPASTRTLIVRLNGEKLWKRVNYQPFHDGQGELSGIFGLVGETEAASGRADAESQRIRTELLQVRERLLARHGFDSLIGTGPEHRRLLDQVAAAAASRVPVLVVGESGTGRHLVARTIHHRGTYASSPLIPIDCEALPAEVLERQIFGGEAGPRMDLAEGTSLLIGDILDLPRDLQGRLVEMLDPRVRLLATTAGEPETELRSERLRSDLYYALTTFMIRLRPLRERLDELPLLAQQLLERFNARGGAQRVGFSDSALQELASYDWPGNIRELARVVEEVHGKAAGSLIQVDDLPSGVRGHLASSYLPPPMPQPGVPLDELLTQVERRLIETTLQRARHNKSRAAELLGISRPRLYRRIKELGLPDVPDPSEDASPSAGGRDGESASAASSL